MNTNQIPPGIVAFKVFKDIITKPHDQVIGYHDWVEHNFNDPVSTIHTISVDGKQWSVGEKANVKGYIDFIISLHYEAGIWIASLKDCMDYDIRLLRKLPVKDSGGEEKMIDTVFNSKSWNKKHDGYIENWDDMMTEAAGTPIAPINPSEPGKSNIEFGKYKALEEVWLRTANERDKAFETISSLQAYNGKLVETLQDVLNYFNQDHITVTEDIYKKVFEALSSFTDKEIKQ